jgi:hypothetical protein
MLLQQTRVFQAMKELDLYRDFRYSHSVPFVKMDGIEYRLVFPRFMFEYENEKSIDFLFIGLKTKSREKFLKNFPDAKIIYSDRGRTEGIKERDEWYFNEMSKAKFVLCPDGDFKWTYRFFESIIFKAIPIIENVSSAYYGYKYYKKGDEYVYRQDWVDFNYNKVKEEMTLKLENHMDDDE